MQDYFEIAVNRTPPEFSYNSPIVTDAEGNTFDLTFTGLDTRTVSFIEVLDRGNFFTINFD